MRALETLRRAWTHHRAIVALTLLGAVIGMLPLVGRLNVEYALFIGLLLPFVSSSAGFSYALRWSQLSAAPTLGQALWKLTTRSWLFVFVPTAWICLAHLLSGACNLLTGLGFVLLGPTIGTMLAGWLGFGIGLLHPGQLSRWIARLLPALGIAIGLYRLWSAPGVFVYGHLFGYFPGALYDQNLELNAAYVHFRLVTLAILAALASALFTIWNPQSMRVQPARSLQRPGLALFTLALIAAVTVCEKQGAQLGYRSSTAHIRTTLGKTIRTAHCITVLPRETPHDHARRLAQDCEFRVRQMERTLQIKQAVPITAFFFRTPEEKRALMGAAHTMIAKPWRNEVYLQLEGWPHPVLAHEIAHVVAGNTGTGPMRVQGKFGGIVPNMAAVEGLATAMAWAHEDDYTTHEWAAALQRSGRLPPIRHVLGLAFLSYPPRIAYTAAGSFYKHVLDRYGPSTVRKAYRSNDLPAAIGSSWQKLERQWHRMLETLPLDSSIALLAEDRFFQRSVFRQACPQYVAQRVEKLALDVRVNDEHSTIYHCQQILRVQPTHPIAQRLLISAVARTQGPVAANETLNAISEGQPINLVARAQAEQSIADAYWQRGQTKQATKLYSNILESPLGHDTQRLVRVKLYALQGDSSRAARSQLREYLLAPQAGANIATAQTYLAREIEDRVQNGLGAYLEGRQLFAARAYRPAAERLRQALNRALPLGSLQLEARKLLGAALYANKRYQASMQAWTAVSKEPLATSSDRDLANDWLERIQYALRSSTTASQTSQL